MPLFTGEFFLSFPVGDDQKIIDSSNALAKH